MTVKRTGRALPDVSSEVFVPPACGGRIGRIGHILCAKRRGYNPVERFMEDSAAADTTQLLRAWADGDSGALEQLTPRVYRELRHMAARLLRNERPGYSLQSMIWFTKSIFVW